MIEKAQTSASGSLIRLALFRNLCILLIGLQAADALSTWWGLSTSIAQEQNQLLIWFSQISGLSLITVVFLAKAVTALLFVCLLARKKVTLTEVAYLFLLGGYLVFVVMGNMSVIAKGIP